MLQYKLPKGDYKLPSLMCNKCGNVQPVFVSSSISCSRCFHYFHMDAFKIAKEVDHRVHYHNGGKCYVAGN